MFWLMVGFRPVFRGFVVVHAFLDYGLGDRDDATQEVFEVLVFRALKLLHVDMIALP